MKIGYARVSTKDQNLELQIDALNKAGCDKIFSDKISSSKEHREGLEQALDYVRPGDTLVVWKLDRLCRSTSELVHISKLLNDKKAQLESLTEKIDTNTPQGRMYFTVIGAIAQFEREVIKERIAAGLEAAKRRGRVGGRPKAMSDSQVKAARQLLESGMSHGEVAEVIGIPTPTLYRYIPANTLFNEGKEK